MSIFSDVVRNGEFRLFFPKLYSEELQCTYKDFGEAIDKLSQAISDLGGPDVDKLETEQMIYVVGRPHWGAKYRGQEKKLQLIMIHNPFFLIHIIHM